MGDSDGHELIKCQGCAEVPRQVAARGRLQRPGPQARRRLLSKCASVSGVRSCVLAANGVWVEDGVSRAVGIGRNLKDCGIYAACWWGVLLSSLGCTQAAQMKRNDVILILTHHK